MLNMHRQWAIRLAIVAVLLVALVAAFVPGRFWDGPSSNGAVLLAQDNQGQESDVEGNEQNDGGGDAAMQDDDGAPSYEYLSLEIAENGYERFSADETPVFEEDGMPAYGAEFVTQGYIYPAGTLTCDNDGCNGVLEDGSAEFPDQVIGEWTCYGFHVGDGAHTATGPWVISTQYYAFDDKTGAESIATSGYEWVDQNEMIQRAIVGGTGAYRYARGEQTQELLGFDPMQGSTLRVTFRMRGW